MNNREYIIFCDESDVSGKHYSNFYGGLMVGSSQYNRITDMLNAEKKRLNLFGEVKWSKVSAQYLDKYEALIRTFFKAVHDGHVRVRIMFRKSDHQAVGLTQEQIQDTYFRLYYQFIKHAFGLQYRLHPGQPTALKLYFDEFPQQSKEAITRFKGYILALKDNSKIRQAGFTIALENIAEIHSHDHVLVQCLDIVLGAMSFRLNHKHREIPPGKKRRGKKTLAKEKLYKTILAEIRRKKKHFNIGISTSGDKASHWSAPYQHWNFIPTSYRNQNQGGPNE